MLKILSMTFVALFLVVCVGNGAEKDSIWSSAGDSQATMSGSQENKVDGVPVNGRIGNEQIGMPTDQTVANCCGQKALSGGLFQNKNCQGIGSACPEGVSNGAINDATK